MEPEIARSVAIRVHDGQLTRFDEPVIEHVERVAALVPPQARALAYLHDVLERSTLTLKELRKRGLTNLECAVLDLLSRDPADSYESYVLRIARAPGAGGRIARMIKLADLDDHLRHPTMPNAPDYAWARGRIVSAQRAQRKRRHESGNVGETTRAAA